MSDDAQQLPAALRARRVEPVQGALHLLVYDERERALRRDAQEIGREAAVEAARALELRRAPHAVGQARKGWRAIH